MLRVFLCKCLTLPPKSIIIRRVILKKEGVSFPCPSVLFAFTPFGCRAQRHPEGETLVSINRTPVLDLVDYQYLTARPSLEVLLEDNDGQFVANGLRVHKLVEEPARADARILPDELPEDLREPLHVLLYRANAAGHASQPLCARRRLAALADGG